MKRWLRLVLQLLSLALFGIILWWAGPGAWRQVLSGNPRHVLVAFFLLGAATMVSATRLQLMVHSFAGRSLGPWRRFYYLSMTARAVGLVMPRTLTVFAGKPLALRSLGLSIRRSVWAVVMDNVFDLVVLGLLAFPALLFLGVRISGQAALALAVGLVITLTAGLSWLTGGSGLARLVGWMERIPHLRKALAHASETATDLVLRRPAAVLALGLTLLLNSALMACYHHISQAVGLSHPWTLFAAGFPAAQLSLVLAVTPGGLGILDAGWYGVLMLGGVPHQDAITFVIAQRAYISLFVLVWAAISVLLSLPFRPRREEGCVDVLPDR